MILRNLSATAADWKFAARAMDELTGSFQFLVDLLQDIGFVLTGDDYDSCWVAVIFAPGGAVPVGMVQGRSEAVVTFYDSSIWAEDEEVCIPCPEPIKGLSIYESMKLDVIDQRTGDHGWRRGLEAAARGEADRPYFGNTHWGRSYQAGLAYGRQFVQ